MFGALLYGNGIGGNEMTFTPVGKSTTYNKIMSLVRLQTKTDLNVFITDDILIEQISLSIQKLVKTTPEIQFYYQYTTTPLPITGTASPFICDLTALNPYIEKILSFTFIWDDGSRDLLNINECIISERLSQLNSYQDSLLGSYEGDNLKIWAGENIVNSIDTSANFIEFKFMRQTIFSDVTSSSKIDLPDSMTLALVSDVSTEILKYK